MQGPESHPVTKALALRVDRGASSAQIAAAVVSAWDDIDTALAPIVGRRGLAALYRRSLHLATAAHPWLAGTQGDAQAATDPATFEAVLARQTSADAAAGGAAFLQTFDELLASLVGAPLTERLLRSVWANHLGKPPEQDLT